MCNLTNENGVRVNNQFVYEDDGKTIFQSYTTKMAVVDGDVVSVLDDWDISRTTTKYLLMFLRMYGNKDVRKKADLQKAIREGDILTF